MWLASAVLAVCAAADGPEIPSWLAPYPGAEPVSRQSAVLAESEYTAKAQPGQVVDHYRRLFAAAGVPFRPDPMGYGFLIRASAESCDVTIRIRNQNGTSAVRVTCARSFARNSTATDQKRQDNERRAVDSMEKYDQPVYPKPKPRVPAPSWPAWLVHPEGRPLQILQIGDPAIAGYLKSSFTTPLDKTALQSFYANLLRANGYEISAQSSTSLARLTRAWVEGARYPQGRPGPRVVIRAEIVAAAGSSSVELRVRSTP